jgi:hypothetical protein
MPLKCLVGHFLQVLHSDITVVITSVGRSNITYTATAFVEVPEEPKENGKPAYQSKKEKEREEKEKEKKKLTASTNFIVLERVDLEVVKSEPRSKEVRLCFFS